MSRTAGQLVTLAGLCLAISAHQEEDFKYFGIEIYGSILKVLSRYA
jgi:hypothetical protein